MTTVALTLRRSTRAVHELAEERLGLPGSLRSRGDVDELLRRWHALFVELDPVLSEPGPHGPPPLPQLVDVLAGDLSARGLRPAAAPGEPARYETAAERAGAVYVVAGAQLGVRQVAGALPPDWRDDSSYLGDSTAAIRSMTDVRAWLDRWDDDSVAGIIVGAEATFERSIEILGASPWTEPLAPAMVGG